MRDSYWAANPKDLPQGWMSATVSAHGWEGWYIFRAYPNRGDHCCEYMSKDLDDCIAKAEAWLVNDADGMKGVYSAAF